MYIQREVLQENLLAWFHENKRALPWRLERSLYGTWISEIMLQQTTVAVVIPYWNNFMEKYPHVRALAEASESDVLASWSGLGYYRRARNLHHAARMVVKEFNGILPETRKEWQSLPGVGAYASGAIASIGLGERAPAVDANASRVLKRWLFDDSLLAGDMKTRELEALAGELVPRQEPGSWNEAVMELGATVCRAKSADCSECPVLDQCRAGLAGNALDIPPGKKKILFQPVVLAALVIRRGQELLLLPPGKPLSVALDGNWEVDREDTTDIHQGLWTLPVSPWYKAGDSVANALKSPDFVLNWLARQLGIRPDQCRCSCLRVNSFSHSITRYRMKVWTWDVQLEQGIELSELEREHAVQFVIPGHGLPVSNLVSKSLKMFGGGNV